MDDATARQLNALTLAFYRDEAEAWDAHRGGPWPGWDRLLPHLPESEPLDVLDVGCGNGRFGRYLAGHRRIARYVGVDGCEPLLDRVRSNPPEADRVELVAADFIEGTAETALPRGRFDLVALFGVLHHVPSDAWRRGLVEASAARVAPGGLLALTAWRFAEVPSLRQRALAPEEIATLTGLDPGRLGPDDYLMPFGPRRSTVRYARALDAPGLAELASGLGLDPIERYTADGRDTATNLYLLLRRPEV